MFLRKRFLIWNLNVSLRLFLVFFVAATLEKTFFVTRVSHLSRWRYLLELTHNSMCFDIVSFSIMLHTVECCFLVVRYISLHLFLLQYYWQWNPSGTKDTKTLRKIEKNIVCAESKCKTAALRNQPSTFQNPQISWRVASTRSSKLVDMLMQFEFVARQVLFNELRTLARIWTKKWKHAWTWVRTIRKISPLALSRPNAEAMT